MAFYVTEAALQLLMVAAYFQMATLRIPRVGYRTQRAALHVLSLMLFRLHDEGLKGFSAAFSVCKSFHHASALAPEGPFEADAHPLLRFARFLTAALARYDGSFSGEFA